MSTSLNSDMSGAPTGSVNSLLRRHFTNRYIYAHESYVRQKTIVLSVVLRHRLTSSTRGANVASRVPGLWWTIHVMFGMFGDSLCVCVCVYPRILNKDGEIHGMPWFAVAESPSEGTHRSRRPFLINCQRYIYSVMQTVRTV